VGCVRMMRRQPVYLVCSPHPRVGTSTTARLLADYHVVEKRPFATFDTDPHERVLATFFPAETTVADLSVTRGQIALFDRLLVPSPEVRIVDIWTRSYRQFFAQASDIGFFEEAERLDLQPIVLFMTNGSFDAVDAADEIARTWPELPMIVVSNEGAAPLGEAVHDHLASFPTDRNFQIPELDPIMRRHIENPNFSLSRFLLYPPSDMSLVVRADLRTWLRSVFAQFHSYHLRNALEGTRYLLK
jgi:hypothetical protein